MSDETLYKLVNPEFDFEFAGKVYHVRKASLDKAVQYQKRLKELKASGTESPEIHLVAYCISLVLKDIDGTITEDFVLQHTPADIDVIECMTTLGFISPSKEKIAREIEANLEKKSTTGSSS